jgi:hypothetical protein
MKAPLDQSIQTKLEVACCEIEAQVLAQLDGGRDMAYRCPLSFVPF